MNLIEVLCSPWAILEDRYAQLRDIYAAHQRGDLDLAAVEARLSRELYSEQKSYEVGPNGVATLSVDGVMAPKANLLMRVSGGVSTQMLTAQIDSMADDARVTSALIRWDSPGGNVISVPAAAAALARLAAKKPTVSIVDGVMASAAYWVGSAANAVYLEGVTNVVGSLGVIQRLSWDEAQPNTMTLARGRYKMLSRDGQPPSEEMLAQINGQLDYLYTELVNAVAGYRGASAEQVLEHMADGRVFTGQQAIDAGLADGFATAADLADQLAADPAKFARRRKARIAVAVGAPAAAAQVVQPQAVPAPQGATTMNPAADTPAAPAAMTRETFQAQHTALFAALQAEFTTAGATAERARIQAVQAQCMPGHEQLVNALAFDGKTTGPEAAVAVLQAERAARGQAAANLAADAPKPVPAAAAPAVPAAPAAQDMSLPVEERCKAAWEASAALRGEFDTLAAYTAYARAEEAGKVRRLTGRAAA